VKGHVLHMQLSSLCFGILGNSTIKKYQIGNIIQVLCTSLIVTPGTKLTHKI